MKKLLLLSALLIFACSSDDNNSNNNYGILPSTITVNSVDDNSLQRLTTYNYDDNKIVSRFDEFFESTMDDVYSTHERVYTYSENKISLVQEYEEGELVDEYIFSYNSQGLISEVDFGFNCSSDCIATITYDSNGLATYGNEGGGWNYIIDNNGNLIYLFLPSSNDSSDGCDIIHNIEYDNYNNPFKNITGISNLGIFAALISEISDGIDFHYYGGNNNPIYANSSVEECDNLADNGNFVNTWQYDYNDNGYPINLIIDVMEPDSRVTIEYTN